MAEIKVRYLGKATIEKLDELAKKKGLSRNEYLKNQLELIALSSEILEHDSKYNLLIEKLGKIITYNTIALNKFLEENLLDLEEEFSEKNFLGVDEINE